MNPPCFLCKSGQRIRRRTAPPPPPPRQLGQGVTPLLEVEDCTPPSKRPWMTITGGLPLTTGDTHAWRQTGTLPLLSLPTLPRKL